MGTQHIPRRREQRTPFNSHLERRNRQKRLGRRRNVHREVKRIGAGHVIELEVLAQALHAEGEG